MTAPHPAASAPTRAVTDAETVWLPAVKGAVAGERAGMSDAEARAVDGAYICAHCAAMAPAYTDMLDSGQTYRCAECELETVVVLVRSNDYPRLLAALTATPTPPAGEFAVRQPTALAPDLVADLVRDADAAGYARAMGEVDEAFGGIVASYGSGVITIVRGLHGAAWLVRIGEVDDGESGPTPTRAILAAAASLAPATPPAPRLVNGGPPTDGLEG